MITITKTRIAAIGLAALASTAIAVPVAASGGDQGVSGQGSCSASSDWKLQASPAAVAWRSNSRLTANGQQWQVRITDNGTSIFRGNRTTVAASGSFEVDFLLAYGVAAADTSPGVEGLRWLAPVYAGDELTAVLTVTDAQPSTRSADLGTVFLQWQMHRGSQLVLQMSGRGWFNRRGPGSPEPPSHCRPDR